MAPLYDLFSLACSRVVLGGVDVSYGGGFGYIGGGSSGRKNGISRQGQGRLKGDGEDWGNFL